MQSQFFVVEPSFGCDFYTEAVRFIPSQSYDEGLTLLFLHANTLHKETFVPLITHFLEIMSPVKIKDIWSIDNPNHGHSGHLNQALLKSDKYRDKWSAGDYTKAAYAFLSSTSHGVEFRKRKLVGVGHSVGGAALMILHKVHPVISFQGFVLLDPAIMPPGVPSSVRLSRAFVKIARSQENTWVSIHDARQKLSRKGMYSEFVPTALELFLKHGLHPVDESGAVTLACSKAHEVAYYASLASDDVLAPPAEALVALSKEDRLSVHLIVGSEDEYKGIVDDTKAFQMNAIGRMKRGSVQKVERGGHMVRSYHHLTLHEISSAHVMAVGHQFPQVEPKLTASYLRNALLKIWDTGVRL
ncbi:hypothetical protein H0H87_007340 [Tephrocybe sp. NHM501043]|nr:hypothetical protein H0H87_007340 [Tephrocybe sp. NHM501043]